MMISHIKQDVARRSNPHEKVQILQIRDGIVLFKTEFGRCKAARADTGKSCDRSGVPDGFNWWDLVEYKPRPESVYQLEKGDLCFIVYDWSPKHKYVDAEWWRGDCWGQKNKRDKGCVFFTREEAQKYALKYNNLMRKAVK